VVFLFRFLFTSFWFRFSEFFWVQFLWIFLTPPNLTNPQQFCLFLRSVSQNSFAWFLVFPKLGTFGDCYFEFRVTNR
jgi:hypothetical protein